MQRYPFRANNRFTTFKIVINLALLGYLALSSGVMAAPPRQEQDVSFITTPANGATVQGAVQIIGNADHPEFQFYVVEFSPDGSDQWQFVGDGQTPVLNGVLSTWNTETVPDGAYLLRLRVVRLDGNFNEAPLQQVIVSNSQPVPTDTPIVIATPADVSPTITPTALPPTPTILIEQPIVDTPTPRPIATTAPLEDPDENSSIIPEVTGFSLTGLRDACLYGGGIMLGIFLLFGFLVTLRTFVQGFVDRIRRK